MQIQQAHRVRHRRATAPDFERDVLLPHSKFACQPGVTLRLFDGVEIGALQVLY